MPYPTAFMIHSVTLRHQTGETTRDDYYNIVPVFEESTTICRLSTQTETVQVAGQAAYIVSTPKIALPSDVEIIENDQIVSTVTGYEGTFTANQVKAVYEPTREAISHYTCKLAAVV